MSKPWNADELLEVTEKALAAYEKSIEDEQITNQALAEIENWQSIYARLNALLDQKTDSAVKTLKKIIEVKDPELLQHSIRVGELAIRIAKAMNLSTEQIHYLETASLFHDIGKIAIRDQILYKKDRLDESEYLAMKKHPVISADILREFGTFNEIAEIVLQHHEKFDGSGYPRRLSGEDILEEARILAVADVYDSLVSNRVYREGLSRQKAFGIIVEENGKHFDPLVIAAMRSLVEHDLI